jgi:cell division protein FtsI (penicillin-binding protein 3)
VLLGVAFTAVAARLVDLQVVGSDSYVARGLAQRLYTKQLPAERGSIFDRNGYELALSVPQHTVWADPTEVRDPVGTAAALAPVLGVQPADILPALKGKGRFAYVRRQIDDTMAEAVTALALPGIHLVGESKRFSPSGDLAASIIGSTTVDNAGLSGLELIRNDDLLGTPGSLQVERGPDGRSIAGGRDHVIPAKRGKDLVLTVDQSLQFEVEQALAEAISKTNAEHATAVVMNPTTGEILAMASVGKDGDGVIRPSSENRAVTAAFEPGSVNKVITVAGALEEGLIQPDTKLTVPDHLQVSTGMFSDHDGHPTVPMTITDIISQSSNVGTIMIAKQLGEARVDAYLRKFGLGSYSGLGFPNETPGLMRKGRWNGTDIGSIPIGQGVSVTALQMLQVFNTLANDGVWVQPSLVRSSVDANGNETRAPEPATRRVVSVKTARQVRAMMASVVSEGTGKSASIAGYTVAGKTGTARKPDNHGGYEIGAYISSFAGFVPAETPKLSAIVVIDEPRPVYYAGIVAAPVFARINQYALRLFKIPPPAGAELPDVPVAKPVDAARLD